MLVQQGHELAGDEAEAPSGDQQGDDHAGQDDVAPTDGGGQGTAEQVVGPAAEQLALQLLGPGTAHELLHEEDVLRDGQHPAQQQRDGDHDEERREQLARDVGREVDRQEGEHGDERRSQQRHGGARHGAEVVVHHRGAGAGGQLRLCVAHLASQLVPELLHILGPDLLFHVDGDFREARPVVALQVVELAERLERETQSFLDTGVAEASESNDEEDDLFDQKPASDPFAFIDHKGVEVQEEVKKAQKKTAEPAAAPQTEAAAPQPAASEEKPAE